MERSSETPWSRQLQHQRAHAVRTVCRTGTDNHQLPVPADSHIQDDLATPTLLKHWHLLNYVFVRQKDLCDVLQTRIMTSADSNADHRPIARKEGYRCSRPTGCWRGKFSSRKSSSPDKKRRNCQYGKQIPSTMLREVKEELSEGIYIGFRTDGSVLNLRRLLARKRDDRGADP